MRPDYGWERPRKVIAHRDPSPLAECGREWTERGVTLRCHGTVRLHITKSPLPEYVELVTQTCLGGHVQRVQGVLQFLPEHWSEDDGMGDGDGPHGV